MPGPLGERPLAIEPLGHREHCRLPATALEHLDLQVGQQVRLQSGDHCALYTVTGTAETVVVDPEGRDRLSADGPVTVAADVFVPAGGPLVGSFAETLRPGSDHLAVLAPHGGEIEAYTDRQAERLAERLGGTAWVCRGTWAGWEAFDRWHITANALHPGSFPGLGRIADRGFDRAVSFHAWLQSGVGVGGAASLEVREAVRDAITDAVGDGYDVFLVEDPAYRGDRPENVVNWLTADGASGIQLEQGGAVRSEYGEAIVDAVATAITAIDA